MARDFALFIGEMIRRPGEVAAIAPSSSAVAHWMTQGLEETDGPIVEIGPGTGVFTKAILARGVAPERLTLLEMGENFCDTLRRKFPGVTVLNRPAQEIDQIGLSNVGAVISGVPMLARPGLQREVLEPALRVMAPDAFFTQITYSLTSPFTAKMQKEFGIVARRRAMVLANLPPATVHELRRA